MKNNQYQNIKSAVQCNVPICVRYADAPFTGPSMMNCSARARPREMCSIFNAKQRFKRTPPASPLNVFNCILRHVNTEPKLFCYSRDSVVRNSSWICAVLALKRRFDRLCVSRGRIEINICCFSLKISCLTWRAQKKSSRAGVGIEMMDKLITQP